MQSIAIETVFLPERNKVVKWKRAVIKWVSNVYACCCGKQRGAAQHESSGRQAEQQCMCTNRPVDFSRLHLCSTDCLWKSSALEASCRFSYWPWGTALRRHRAAMRGRSRGIMWPLSIVQPMERIDWMQVSTFRPICHGQWTAPTGGRDGRCNIEWQRLIKTQGGFVSPFLF